MDFLINNNLNYRLNRDDIQKEILKFTLFLNNLSYLPDSGVDEIIQTVDNLISQLLLPYLNQSLNSQLKGIVSDAVLKQIKFIIDQSNFHFKNFSTKHLRYKQYEQKSVYVEPIEYKIGEETVLQMDQFGEYTNVPKKVTVSHIPIPQTLKVILEVPDIFYEMRRYKKDLLEEKDYIQNVVQGKLWLRKYERHDRESYPLFLFFDDFETGNTLGSHAGNQKLGGLYFSLPCLPPQITAELKNSFFCLSFHSGDRLKYGNYLTFKQDIDELIELSENGLKFSINGEDFTIYFHCVLLLGDNLGLNSCCGFVESFNANYYCRICRAKSDLCQTMSKECVSLLRTQENYVQDLQRLSFGIKEECVFNRIKDFHITENKTLDIMHDIFEGIAVYTLENVINILVLKDNILKLEDINNRIQTFPYGHLESRNKPTVLKLKENTKNKITGGNKKIIVKQSASEMLCLCRYLPLMIGDLIPRNNKPWKLFRILRKIIGIITRSNHAISHVNYIDALVMQFNTLYLQLLGTLPPKGHFGTHVPRIMLDNGPPTQFWGMIHESMNKDMKDIVKNVKCHRNVPFTIAKNNALRLCYIKEFGISKTTISLGSIINQNTDDEIKSIIGNTKGDLNSKSYSWVRFQGKMYHEKDIIVCEINEEPQFARIEKIYQIKDCIYIYGHKFKNIYFESYFHAYKVEMDKSDSILINVDLLPKVDPCILVNREHEYFIVSRSDL